MQVVTEMMMGKRVDLSLNVGAYQRSFQGEQSPMDLDTCFQLLYRLFTHQVKPTDSNLATCLKSVPPPSLLSQTLTHAHF